MTGETDDSGTRKRKPIFGCQLAVHSRRRLAAESTSAVLGD
jgi:hypothetical protein